MRSPMPQPWVGPSDSALRMRRSTLPRSASGLERLGMAGASERALEVERSMEDAPLEVKRRGAPPGRPALGIDLQHLSVNKAGDALAGT